MIAMGTKKQQDSKPTSNTNLSTLFLLKKKRKSYYYEKFGPRYNDIQKSRSTKFQ